MIPTDLISRIPYTNSYTSPLERVLYHYNTRKAYLHSSPQTGTLFGLVRVGDSISKSAKSSYYQPTAGNQCLYSVPRKRFVLCHSTRKPLPQGNLSYMTLETSHI